MDNEDIYNLYVVSELDNNEIESVDDFIDNNSKDEVDHFFQQVMLFGVEEAMSECYID